jgi:hypothetical protein
MVRYLTTQRSAEQQPIPNLFFGISIAIFLAPWLFPMQGSSISDGVTGAAPGKSPQSI